MASKSSQRVIDSSSEGWDWSNSEAAKIKAWITQFIGKIIYWKDQFESDWYIRSDRKNFIRAIMSSYIPWFWTVPLLWFKAEVNKEAADRARKVVWVDDFVKDIEADRKWVEAALINFFIMNPVITFILSKMMFGAFLENDTSTYAAIATTFVNFAQSYLVLRLARDDHKATAESWWQKLKDIPPDQWFRNTGWH